MGLAISRALADRMGGSMAVESTLDGGSTFSLRLSAALASAGGAAQAKSGRSRRELSLAGMRVLLVEDDEMNRELVGIVLAAEGVIFSEAENGAAAIELATARAFDLILMDMQMPVMDGLQAARRIRELPGPSASAPIIAFSANVMPQDVARCEEAGMNGHIAKPFTGQALIAAIADVAVTRRMTREAVV